MKSIMFFIMMLATLFARVRPASTSAKPACMKITRTADNSTKALSRSAFTDSAVTSCAAAGLEPTKIAPLHSAATIANRRFTQLLLSLIRKSPESRESRRVESDPMRN